MRCNESKLSRELMTRELREMLLRDGDAVTHALYCLKCDTRDIALRALALGDWEEVDYLMALAARHA